MTEPTHVTITCPECGTDVGVDLGSTPTFRLECPDCGVVASGMYRHHLNEPTWRWIRPPDADLIAE